MGNLIVGDVSGVKVIKFSGITSTVTDSFSATEATIQATSIDGSGNILTAENNLTVYIYSGFSNTVSSSFDLTQTTTPAALSIDPSGNLVVSEHSASSTIWIHSGVTATVTSSFDADSSNNAGIAFTSDGDMLILSYTTDKIYVHSGSTATINDSFAAPIPGTMRGLTVDYSTGNLISADYEADSKVYIHSGITGTISSSFTVGFYIIGALLDSEGGC